MHAVCLIEFVLVFWRALLRPAIRGNGKPACVPPQYSVRALPVPPFFFISFTSTGGSTAFFESRACSLRLTLLLFGVVCSGPSEGQLCSGLYEFIDAQYILLLVLLFGLVDFTSNIPPDPSPLAPIKAGPNRLDARRQPVAITGVRARD